MTRILFETRLISKINPKNYMQVNIKDSKHNHLLRLL